MEPWTSDGRQEETKKPKKAVQTVNEQGAPCAHEPQSGSEILHSGSKMTFEELLAHCEGLRQADNEANGLGSGPDSGAEAAEAAKSGAEGSESRQSDLRRAEKRQKHLFKPGIQNNSKQKRAQPREVEIDGTKVLIDPSTPYSRRGPMELEFKHRQVMMMVLMNMSTREIAKEVGWSVQTIRIIRRSPLFKSEVRKRELAMEAKVLDIPGRFKAKGPAAYRTIAEILDSDDLEGVQGKALRRLAALDVLKYGGFDPPKLHHHTSDFGKTVAEAWELRKKAMNGGSNGNGNGGNGDRPPNLSSDPKQALLISRESDSPLLSHASAISPSPPSFEIEGLRLEDESEDEETTEASEAAEAEEDNDFDDEDDNPPIDSHLTTSEQRFLAAFEEAEKKSRSETIEGLFGVGALDELSLGPTEGAKSKSNGSAGKNQNGSSESGNEAD